MDKFELVNKYNILVRRGYAAPLACEQDGSNFVTRLNDGVTPRFHCYTCDSDYYLSDQEWAAVEAVVQERLR